MNKKIKLLLTLIISLFVFSNRVEAAKELTCVYDFPKQSGVELDDYMVVQDSNGKLSLYKHTGSDKPTYKSDNWKKVNLGSEENANHLYTSKLTDKYKKNGSLVACPPYADARDNSTWSESFTDVELYDCQKDSCDDSIFVYPEGVLYEPLDYDVFNPPSDKLGAGVESCADKDDWIAKCVYFNDPASNVNDWGSYVVYFNQNNFCTENHRKDMIGPDTVVIFDKGFSAKSFYEFYSVSYYCPSAIYEKGVKSELGALYFDYVELYFENPPGITGRLDGNDWHTRLNLDSYNTQIFEGKDNDDNDEDISLDACKDLLGDAIINRINDVMDVIKIALPILLIVLGILDFTKVIFSGKDDELSKSGKKFMMRIVAALLVYLSPIFVNLLLNVANEVWSFINPDICVK